MNPYLERHLTVIGLGIVAVHGISTLLVEPNQFFFDQGRQIEDLQKIKVTPISLQRVWDLTRS